MKKLTKEEEQQLLHECLKDCSKCERLVQHYERLIYHSVRKTLILKHVSFIPEDIEDLCHDVYVALFDKECKKLRQYREDGGLGLSGWIRMIAVQTVLMKLRENDPQNISGQGNLSSFEQIEKKPDLISEMIKIETRETLRLVLECVEKLPPLERLVFELRFLNTPPLSPKGIGEVEETTKSLAQFLNTPPLSPKGIAKLLSKKENHIHQIIFGVRKRLKEYVEEAGRPK